MSGLYFLGLKKSTIKKTPPFKYWFEWRDKKVYNEVLDEIKNKFEVRPVSKTEFLILYPLQNKVLKVTCRKFPSSDLSVFKQVFLENCYLPIVEKMLEHTPAAAAIRVVDAGSNVGYSCMYFKSFFPSASIIAIEPEQTNRTQLVKNLAANNFELATLIDGGLWHRPAFLEVERNFRDNREAAFTVKETQVPTGIKGFGFEEILTAENWDTADLVKIDIEGSERFLFDTPAKADGILTKTKFLAIEIHDEFEIRPTIYDHLTRNGFDYFEFDDLTLAINQKMINK